MSLRAEKDVKYLEVNEFNEGYSIFAQPRHSASLVAFFRVRDIPFTLQEHGVGDDDVLEFSKDVVPASIRQTLDEWKQHYVIIEDQRKGLALLKARLKREKDKKKHETLRKSIRELGQALYGKTAPGNSFSEDEWRKWLKKGEADQGGI